LLPCFLCSLLSPPAVSSLPLHYALPIFLGVIVFIDDYFSALIVGQVAKPLTDKYQVSRAKLAYFIDTTATPGIYQSAALLPDRRDRKSTRLNSSHVSISDAVFCFKQKKQ